MSKRKKRDRAYFLKRLKNEHPHIHAELLAGKYLSVREASLKAGLIRQPSRLLALMREWRHASAKEQREFLDWVSGSKPASPTLASLVDKDGVLTLEAFKEIDEVRKAKGWGHGDVMEKLGYDKLDGRLGRTTSKARPWRPDKEFLDRLESFIRRYRR
jgi:hypothetical protein